MPHGHLTPLGRQLRTVLANLSVRPQSRTSRFRARNGNDNGIRKFHSSSPARSERTCPTQEGKGEETQEFDPLNRSLKPGGTSPSPRKWKKLTAHLRTDHLSEAIHHAGYSVAQHSRSEADWSISNVGVQRPSQDENLEQESSAEPTLQSILAKYIRDAKGETDPVRARWEPSYTTSAQESQFLLKMGYTEEDVDVWSDIVLATRSDRAAEQLALRARDSKSDPMFLLMHTLGRKCISAGALREIIMSISLLLGETKKHGARRNPSLLVVIVRLIRHAREVWPQSLSSIVSLFLYRLQHQDFDPNAKEEGRLQFATFALNKIMSLVSLSTAVMPFKDNVFQETAIIPILQYMDAHDPPLHVTRAGYRAVIRIQLAQRKTLDEQQWAELKALSWPPWKVDRTAMDASVGLECGITRARATLFSMRSAGYASLVWEKAAEAYTGWDPDGTPTVQRRVLLGSSGTAEHDNDTSRDGTQTVLYQVVASGTETPSKSTYWASRIDSTRTIQEAWACYLAWEDAKLPHDQNVYLTIMQKLQEEANRQREDAPQTGEHPAWDLLPGDTPQLSPLPPSTHLYTYTRTAPPKLNDFYRTLRDQGVRFTGHCLAFLLRNSSLQAGLARMEDSLPQFPELQGILTLDPAYNTHNLPSEIFTAAIQLLARSGGYFLNDSRWSFHTRVYELPVPSSPDSDQDHYLDLFHQNKNSVIIRAIELLRRRPDCTRQTWVAVFAGLSRETNSPGIGQGLNADSVNIESSPPEEIGILGAVLAYGMTRRLVRMYRDQFSDLDSMAFHQLCLITEAMARAVWTADLMSEEDAGKRKVKETIRSLNHDARFIASGLAGKELRGEFRSLVGNMTGDVQEIIGGAKLPRLLFIPNPAMLHVYIRALGWVGDFKELRRLVYWMREFREEIEERKSRDRLGRDMFRRAIVALRVFLEREWRVGDRTAGDGVDLDARLGAAADQALVDGIRDMVNSVEEWEGWATDEEIRAYASDKRFDGLRGE